MLKAVFTQGDGNCLCQSVSKANYNHDGRHVELRVQMVMEGIENINYYLSDECLEHSASYTHGNGDLPTIFATFSDFYTPRQRLTKETIRYIYIMEIHFCCRIGSYMGLWQLGQAASVIGKLIHTIYPVRGQSTLRNDFHRIFFPVNYPTSGDERPIVIMWTAVTPGGAPIHFVPLVTDNE